MPLIMTFFWACKILEKFTNWAYKLAYFWACQDKDSILPNQARTFENPLKLPRAQFTHPKVSCQALLFEESPFLQEFLSFFWKRKENSYNPHFLGSFLSIDYHCRASRKP
jgi:hypothetical protein